MISEIKKDLSSHFEPKVIDELLEAYTEAKYNYMHGGFRLNAVEAGRFCEAVLRSLEYITTGKSIPLNNHINTEKVIRELSNLSSSDFSNSIRLHIPRSVRVIYDIRNKRDTAHLADGIDPNIQDSTLVISVIDWILAELVRLYHNVTAKEAQNIIQSLVTRNIPIIEEFDGFLKVLNPKLKASQYCLVLLYQLDKAGASYEEILAWIKPEMRSNLKRTLKSLEVGKLHIHFDGKKYFITRIGKLEVEKRKYYELKI